MSKASAAFTSPLGGIKGGEYYRWGESTDGFQSGAVKKKDTVTKAEGEETGA